MSLSSQKAFISRLTAVELTLHQDDFHPVEKLFSEYLGFCLFKNHKSNLSLLKKNSTGILLKPSERCSSSHVSGVCFSTDLTNFAQLNHIDLDEFESPFKRGFNCAGFNFYFSDALSFENQQLVKAGFVLAPNYPPRSAEIISNAFQLVIDHLALYVTPNDALKITNVLENNLLFQKKNSYTLAHPAALEVIPFEANCTRLNLIIDQKACKLSNNKDPYSHLALGTNEIFTLAEIIRQATTQPDLKLKFLPLGGPLKATEKGFTNPYYEETKKLYRSLQSTDIELMKRYGIGYDENINDSKSRGWQFFVQTPFGLLEGIKRLKNFQFTARLGEGITQGISTCEQRTKKYIQHQTMTVI